MNCTMTTNTRPAQRQILLIEDNPAEARLACEAMLEGGMAATLLTIPSGRVALTALQSRAANDSAGLPDLILLDLHLPDLGGLAVLEAVKGDPDLRHIPVIVLSSSRDPADVARAYQAGVNCYLAKPLELTEFVSLLRIIDDFWLHRVTLPPRG